jgi:hypothetical protein
MQSEKASLLATGGIKGSTATNEEKGLELKLSGDAYDAVVAAAFDGIHINLPESKGGKRQFIRLHPIFVGLFCGLLFMVQLSCMACLVLDMELQSVYTVPVLRIKVDIEDGVKVMQKPEKGSEVLAVIKNHETPYTELDKRRGYYKVREFEHYGKNGVKGWVLASELDEGKAEASWVGFDDCAERQMKLMVRVLMVLVLQLLLLKEILGALRPICLIINPFSWWELQRPPLLKAGFGFRAWICAPTCLFAQCMQLFIAYYVLPLSMSIIIVAKDVKEMVFNGLVVTFLADLDEYAWSAMSAIFHMDQKLFEEFQFKLVSKSDDPKTHKHRQEVVAAHPQTPLSWLQGYLYRGKGGKVSVIENFFIFTVLIIMYTRQLFMFVQAIDTGILPVARDVCSGFRAMEHPHKKWFAYYGLVILDKLTFINYGDMLKSSVRHEDILKECHEPKYMDGPMTHAAKYIEGYPYVWSAMIGMACIFAVPQFFYAAFQQILHFLGFEKELVDDEDGNES